MSAADDPRDPSLETKISLPKAWGREITDNTAATFGMFLSGLIMVTKNRHLAWPNLIFAISSAVNQHPLRTKESGNPPWSSLMMAVFAIFASYAPMFILPPSAAPTQTPSPVPEAL